MLDTLRRREFRVIYQSNDHEYYSSTILLARSHRGARSLFAQDERYVNCKCVLTLVL
jgi:hypothetical protein